MKNLFLIALCIISSSALADECDLKGPAYFANTPSTLSLDCRAEINAQLKQYCSTTEDAVYAPVSESKWENTDYGIGRCEVVFAKGYVILQWDEAPGFSKVFSLAGLECPAAAAKN